jgi:protein-S-isoprenylcysteine O-methyltransferase Ste14
VAIALPWLAGWILTRTVGDPIALGVWRVPVGLALGAFFVVWNGWSLWLFARHETGLLPGQPTRAIIEEGPYRASRNPLYLGLVAFDVALALLAPSVWALILVPAAVVLLEWGAIRPEERYLRRRFGAGYDAYAARVRRWL